MVGTALRIARFRVVWLALGAVMLGTSACIVRRFDIQELSKTSPRAVGSPVKAHVVDGSTVVFARGATIDANTVSGAGWRYPVRGPAFEVGSVSLDSVVGMEAFRAEVNLPATTLASAGAIVLGTGLAVGAAVAIFGSCPTYYVDSAGTPVLQGEGFSYSIARIFENRDVDRLRLHTDADGSIRVEVRNEALETHYINHLELLEVAHSATERAIPDTRGAPILVSGVRAPALVLDRAERTVTAELSAADGVVYATDRALIASRTSADLDDHLDFSVPAPRGADSVALVLRMRNSLLNTVLLYDQMLAGAGVGALDWLNTGLESYATALTLAQWYTAHMGLRVSVREGNNYLPVTRIPDTGPIAFHDVVVLVPVSGDSAHVRLSFVADNWRIESLGYASAYRRSASRTIPIAQVIGSDGARDEAALASLVAPDENHLQTTPGQSFKAVFDAGPASEGTRTFFLGSQGYYTEWIRPSWLRTAQPRVFEPSAEALLTALRSWDAKRDDFERQFYASTIPVR